MGYVKWSYDTLNHFCGDVFKAFGFSEERKAEREQGVSIVVKKKEASLKMFF